MVLALQSTKPSRLAFREPWDGSVGNQASEAGRCYETNGLVKLLVCGFFNGSYTPVRKVVGVLDDFASRKGCSQAQVRLQ